MYATDIAIIPPEIFEKEGAEIWAHCDIFQRAKHPNRAYEIERVSHLPTRPGQSYMVESTGRIGYPV
jgi:hypothetical protein